MSTTTRGRKKTRVLAAVDEPDPTNVLAARSLTPACLLSRPT